MRVPAIKRVAYIYMYICTDITDLLVKEFYSWRPYKLILQRLSEVHGIRRRYDLYISSVYKVYTKIEGGEPPACIFYCIDYTVAKHCYSSLVTQFVLVETTTSKSQP